MPENVNIHDISARSGVSVSTVSRVLNNHPDVSKKTREKVMAVIHQSGYVPNQSARNLKREHMHAVAVVVKGFTNPFFTPMIKTIQDELDEHKYITIFLHVDPRQDEVEAAISLYKEKKPEGLVFLGGSFEHSHDRLELLDLPFVMVTTTLESDFDKEKYSSITIDDFAESFQLAKRVAAAGHKKIGVIANAPTDKSISSLRVTGFREGLFSSGVGERDFCIYYAGDFSMEAGYETAKHMLQHENITCLFCISDVIALGAMRAIHDAGNAIPADVSVIGFDGITAAFYSIPSLATVQQPAEEMAHESIRMLIRRMERDAQNTHVVMKATFKEGESFAPPTQ